MNENWKIVAPSEKKAKIIMNYIIEHIYDNVIFESQLDHDTAERLKKETSKKRITFKNGGEVEIITLDSRNGKKNIEAAMGFGAPNVVLDESSLVDDPLYATVKRMLGGHKDNFLFEIGNPFYRNHFYRTWEFDNNYHKVFIDYHQALEEGRFTLDFIEEMRREAFFDVFYECKFPDENALDIDGFRQLLLTNEIKVLPKDAKVATPTHMGIDVGAGGDNTSIVIRGEKRAQLALKTQTRDTMATVGLIREVIDKFKMIKHPNITIDDIGIGRGVSDRLQELGYALTPVAAGAKAKDPKRFFNRKAEMAKYMADWVKSGGEVPMEVKEQLTWLKFDASSDKQMRMEKKERMIERTNKSPDEADALMLTFYQKTNVATFKQRPRGL